MTSVIQKPGDREKEEGSSLAPPQGWIAPEDFQAAISNHTNEINDYQRSRGYNLPLAAKRAEQLIEALNERLVIPVPISYMRIDDDTSFHVLLLINRVDYLSPKIYAARLLARTFTNETDTFDIHFVFTVKSENMMPDAILSQGYKLMHISGQEQNAA